MAPRRPVLSLRQLASARVKAALIRYLSLKTKEVNLIQQNAKLNAQLFREHCRVALHEIDENFPVCLRSVLEESFENDKNLTIKSTSQGCSTQLGYRRSTLSTNFTCSLQGSFEISMPLQLITEVCIGREMYRINRWFID
jgi:hypothetical protein